ncbi:hypothetical protein [Nocardia tengchongensis]|uniref:hypothetical protein n=1 Tax=Nocardia tengchongensis TaxID=2055889 RepID=UPI00364CCAEA
MIAHATLEALVRGADWSCTSGFKPVGGSRGNSIVVKAGDFVAAAGGKDTVRISVTAELHTDLAPVGTTYTATEASARSGFSATHPDAVSGPAPGVGDKSTVHTSVATASARLVALAGNVIIRVDYTDTSGAADATVPAGDAATRIAAEVIAQLR